MAEARLWVRVQPNAAKSEIVGFSDGVLRVRITAPPVRGRANAELINFLAKKLGVSRSQVMMVRGEKSRSKLIVIEGLNRREEMDSLLSG